jgi:hypothetical protein
VLVRAGAPAAVVELVCSGAPPACPDRVGAGQPHGTDPGRADEVFDHTLVDNDLAESVKRIEELFTAMFEIEAVRH